MRVYKSFSVIHVFPPSNVMQKHNALESLVKVNVLGLENSAGLNFGFPKSKVIELSIPVFLSFIT